MEEGGEERGFLFETCIHTHALIFPLTASSSFSSNAGIYEKNYISFLFV
jgi:hypothetical protein